MNNIIIYHSHDCPKCKILMLKFKLAGIEFTESEDVQFLVDKGFKSAPITEINGEYYDYIMALKWIKDHQEGKV